MTILLVVTVTLFPCPEGVTVSGDLCSCIRRQEASEYSYCCLATRNLHSLVGKGVCHRLCEYNLIIYSNTQKIDKNSIYWPGVNLCRFIALYMLHIKRNLRLRWEERGWWRKGKRRSCLARAQEDFPIYLDRPDQEWQNPEPEFKSYAFSGTICYASRPVFCMHSLKSPQHADIC